MLDCLDRHPLPAIRLSEAEGEVAGISYRIRGTGPPLVLMPLSLAPSQWDLLIATLSARYCTLSLGGPLLGVVGNVLESAAAQLHGGRESSRRDKATGRRAARW